MDNTKAIQVLTRWIQFLNFSTKPGRYSGTGSLADLSDACKIAVGAVEKQIAKPVVVKRKLGYLRSDYSCPVCDEEIRETFQRRREGCYCERCGQRLSF